MKTLIGLFCLAYTFGVWAAKPLDLEHKSIHDLYFLNPVNKSFAHSEFLIQQSEIDFNQTKHIRIKQFYHGYPVIRGDIILHLREPNHLKINTLKTILDRGETINLKMNGIVYQNIEDDLKRTPSIVFTESQKSKALKKAILGYSRSNHEQKISHQSAQLMVYVDEQNESHWVYWIKFYLTQPNQVPELPGFVMDAKTFKIYHQWSEIENLSGVKGGGHGGNDNISMLTYDGGPENMPALDITRDDELAMCYMSNDEVTVRNLEQNKNVVQYPCLNLDSNHNNVYWNQDLEMVNGGYSPANDAFYAATMARKMFKDWYHLAPIVKYGKPLSSTVLIHLHANNAFWDPVQMAVIIGDGNGNNYPLTTIDTIAHEIAHGFTIQHSRIVSMDNQSGAIVESFSDITGQAVQYYARGSNDWMVAHDSQKSGDPNAALRYLDNPTRDGYSIDSWRNYNNNKGAHLVGGIFNKAFYLLATTPGWNVRMAYNVWLQANRYYWLPLPSLTSFGSAACGVLSASEDYAYDKAPIKEAFKGVGIDTSNC